MIKDCQNIGTKSITLFFPNILKDHSLNIILRFSVLFDICIHLFRVVQKINKYIKCIYCIKHKIVMFNTIYD